MEPPIPAPGCANCLALQSRLDELQAQVTELTARLNRHSGNSSLPPSSDPPSAPPRLGRPRSKRKRGGQRGHPGHHRPQVEPEQITERRECFPEQCRGCGQALVPADRLAVTPRRRRMIDVPPIQPVVTEFLVHACRCRHCGVKTWAAPPTLGESPFGPRVHALLAGLTGAYRVSRRDAVALVEEFFGLRVSLGALGAIERRVASALEPVCTAVADAVSAAPVVWCDETPWKAAGQRQWLWLATTRELAHFRIDPSRSREASTACCRPPIRSSSS